MTATEGVEATKGRARQSVFWPGIDSDIANTGQSLVRHVRHCSHLSRGKPLRMTTTRQDPSESVSADFFVVAGKSFLVVVDRLSGWPVVAPCQGDTTDFQYYQDFFLPLSCEVGVPLPSPKDRWRPPIHQRRVQGFYEAMGSSTHGTSPHYPQSNGHAEAAVKSIKHLILKTAPIWQH
ncbi:uncharacterized protein LOC135201230 [Macrobrachium nipponense]|uniref:uncharacterized protein LOC135201230 n=1 Tax=Macrobrachium nipponense TaxID=159736 RepID=UPI0030C7B61F